MSFLATVFSGLKYLSHRIDDDIADRLQYHITSNLLLALAMLVSFKQFGGKPVECMIPDIFSHSWEQYVEQYCWAESTYYLPMGEIVPLHDRDRDSERVSYYQWVPFFLVLESLCFQIPCMIWKLMAGHSGIKIHSLVREAVDPKNIQAAARKETIKTLRTHMENALRFHRRMDRRNVTPHSYLKCFNLPYSACYVTATYLFVKVCYLVNAMVQFHLLNVFLQTSSTYRYYGFSAVLDMLNHTAWEHSGAFPRVTLCDFEVREMGNIVKYTVQCVLSINIFNEKIFVFLWFWYMALVFIAFGSFVYWASITMFPCFGRWFIVRHLELAEVPFDSNVSKKEVARFVGKYLRTDGVFTLRMLTMHAGVIFGTDLVCALWTSFFGCEQQKQAHASAPNLAETLEAQLKNRFSDVRMPKVVDQAREKFLKSAGALDMPDEKGGFNFGKIAGDSASLGRFMLSPPDNPAFPLKSRISHEESEYERRLEALRKRPAPTAPTDDLTEVLIVPHHLKAVAPPAPPLPPKPQFSLGPLRDTMYARSRTMDDGDICDTDEENAVREKML